MDTTAAEPYRVGSTHLVTMVRGWWLQELEEEPEWLPTMGPLHEDEDFFSLPAFHFHVDPRFLDERLDKRVEADRRREMILGARDASWHPSYRRVMTNFPSDDGKHYIEIDEGNAYLLEKRYGTIVSTHPKQWGIDRIATRTRRLLCRRELPAACLSQSSSENFAKLREAYGRPAGDRCPHRGYDLRSVPIGPDGRRQCPLHQLRVRAPDAEQCAAMKGS